MDVSLEGKVALVTGCGPNIGSGIALALSRYGAKVAVNDVSKESIDACLARIERNGGTAMAAPGDVTDEETVKGYVNDVLAAWGKIDILVNNAALLGGRGVLDESAEVENFGNAFGAGKEPLQSSSQERGAGEIRLPCPGPEHEDGGTVGDDINVGR